MKKGFKNLKLALLSSILVSHTAMSYDIVNRAKLIDDRFKTLEMMRPYGHDFYLDINGALTTEVMDLKDDIDKIGDIDTGSTTTDIDKVNEVLEKYYDKEQVLRARFGFGIPIFSFSVSDVNIKPNLRVDAGLMAILTPTKDNLAMTDILKSIGNIDGVPKEAIDKFTSCISSLGPTDDGKNLIEICSLTAQEKAALADAGIEEIPFIYSIKTASQDVPAIDVYAKIEAKAGLWFDYTKGDHFFGTLGLYGLGRIDVNKSANVALLLGDSAGLDVTENTLVNAAIDYKFGYKNDNYSAYLSVEELKLSELSSEDNGATPDFGTDPLIRLHAQADYKVSVFKMSPYLGLHKRAGYDLADGMYVGADWGVFVWEDRLGLNFKTGLDKEHMTLGMRAKLWFMHLDLTGKFAVTSKVDDIEVSNYYAANFRLFF